MKCSVGIGIALGLMIAVPACMSGRRTGAPKNEVQLQRESNPFVSNLPGPINDIDGSSRGLVAPRPSHRSSYLATPAEGRVERTAENIGALLAQADELWVLTPEGLAALDRPQIDELPGCGGLITQIEEQTVPLPLEHTHVTGDVVGSVAEVTVIQTFRNPYDTKIEAVYLFPLPERAAVTDFVMQIGERRIRGVVRERTEAEQIYREARSQGYTASLLTQERPNIFTQSVANLEPSKSIEVEITYFDRLPYRDGAYEFIFPMVVGPRYNPPGSTDGIGAVPRGHATPGATEVSYLRPNERSGHDVSLAVTIDAGLEIEQLSSPSHAVNVERVDERRAEVVLSPNDAIPNRDFVLRIEIAGDQVKSGVLAHGDSEGGYFALTLVPPRELRAVRRQPMEFVFVLDCSGSMRGVPLNLAKSATERCLRRLDPSDTFQIIRFSASASQLGDRPLAANHDNVERGVRYLRDLGGGGGTQMIEGIKAALDFPPDDERQRVVSFMTDGFIGNEIQILAAIAARLGDTRLFSFGVGSSVNRYLLDSMARLGRGAVAYVGLDENAAQMADRFYERIRHPALENIAIDFGDLDVSDLSVTRIPDLYVGRPVTVLGRFSGDARRLRIRGDAGGRSFEQAVSFDLADRPEISTLWARSTIERLSDHYTVERDPTIAVAIRDLALRHKLMSAYTAFIAVDTSRRTDSDHGVVVPVAVPVPKGVRYDTTVGRGRSGG